MVNPDLLRKIVDEAAERELIGTGTYVDCARVLNNRKRKVFGKEKDTNKEITLIELTFEKVRETILKIDGDIPKRESVLWEYLGGAK